MLVVAAIALVALLLLQQWQGTEDPSATPPATTPKASSTAGATTPDSLRSLPPEAIDTIALIQSNGPFPYRKDGTVFMNRERRLPSRDTGYWREYTVKTPGESDRGARRIVHGRGDEFYYTDDHYGSFTLLEVPARVRR